MDARGRFAWAMKVFKQLEQQLPLFKAPVELVFLAGQSYRKDLVKTLHEFNSLERQAENKVKISEPMAGMSIGKQLQWLGLQISKCNR